MLNWVSQTGLSFQTKNWGFELGFLVLVANQDEAFKEGLGFQIRVSN